MPKSIQIAAPRAGEHVSIPADAARRLVFEFDPADAVASRARENLVFTIGGGTVTLAGFFTAKAEALPDMVMPDGLEIAAADLRDGLFTDFETG